YFQELLRVCIANLLENAVLPGRATQDDLFGSRGVVHQHGRFKVDLEKRAKSLEDRRRITDQLLVRHKTMVRFVELPPGQLDAVIPVGDAARASPKRCKSALGVFSPSVDDGGHIIGPIADKVNELGR